jgi:uncharacterized protein (DUF58 family)
VRRRVPLPVKIATMADAAAISAPQLRHSAERAAARLPPLLVAAQRVAATVAQGVHGRRRVGIGDAFWQFRRYEPGDPIRRIDWRQSAKSDRVFVRETEWSAAQSVWLWSDPSRSMRWRSRKTLPEKAERSDLLTVAVASLLVRAGERVALLGTGERPITGKVALERLTARILALRNAVGSEEMPPLEPLPRYATLILVGDFLAPLEQIDSFCRRYAASAVRGYLLQVLDPAEESLPYAGRTRFEGLEDEGHLLVKRVETVRDEYRQKMVEQQAGLSDITRTIGWYYTVHRTDTSPESALLPLFVHLSQVPR